MCVPLSGAKRKRKTRIMAKSSIHFEEVKSTSMSHNLRQRDFDYVRKDLTPLNGSYGDIAPHPEVIQELKEIIKEKTGRTAQAKSVILKEGVFLFEERHTDQELKNVAMGFSKKFGVKVKELHVHRDEGHYEKHTKQWIPNYHAHLVIENINRNTGKSLRWSKDDLSAIQDYFAEALQMERGKKSNKKHLSALDFKIQQKDSELKEAVLNLRKTTNSEELALVGRMLYDFMFKEKLKSDYALVREFVEYRKNHPLNERYEKARESLKEVKPSINQKRKL